MNKNISINQTTVEDQTKKKDRKRKEENGPNQ